MPKDHLLVGITERTLSTVLAHLLGRRELQALWEPLSGRVWFCINLVATRLGRYVEDTWNTGGIRSIKFRQILP